MNQNLQIDEWKECLNNIRYYHNQANQVSMWIIGTLILIIGFVIKLILEKSYILSGILLISLFWLISYLGYIQKRNIIYYIGSIKRINQIELGLNVGLSKTLLKTFKQIQREDILDERIEAFIGNPDSLRIIKYFFFILGYLLILFGIYTYIY